MAWTLDSCEVEIKLDGAVDGAQNGYYHVEDLFIREVSDLVFYGRIRDCDDSGLVGALLKVFALRPDGREVALVHTYSGKNGYYLVNVPKPDFAVSRYIIRSSMSVNPPGICEQALNRSKAAGPEGEAVIGMEEWDE